MSQADEDLELVRAVTARDAAAIRQLLQRLSPVVRHRVARVLLQHTARGGRAVRREDVDDLQHDVFLVLFDRDYRVLRAWDPTRGLSLENFCGLVAQREAGAILRSGRRSTWAENPSLFDDNDDSAGTQSRTPEDHVAAREELSALLDALRDRLSPRALLIFEALFVDTESVEQVCARFDMTANALYIFRNRLQSMLAKIQLESEPRRAASSRPVRSISKRVSS
jgi:RNA polymerase sigma-70 factor (ECF subfamily)